MRDVCSRVSLSHINQDVIIYLSLSSQCREQVLPTKTDTFTARLQMIYLPAEPLWVAITMMQNYLNSFYLLFQESVQITGTVCETHFKLCGVGLVSVGMLHTCLCFHRLKPDPPERWPFSCSSSSLTRSSLLVHPGQSEGKNQLSSAVG